MIIPVGVDYNARRYPVVTFTLMGLNVFVYLLAWFAFLTNDLEGERNLAFALGLVPAHPSWHGWLTSMFTQLGLFHLLGNMVYLYLFGACVEDLLGRLEFVLFYLLGGFAADLIHVAVSLGGPIAGIPVIGASGAVSACIGGFALLLPKTKINFRYIFWIVWLWTGEFWLPSWLVISFWFLVDLLSAFANAGDAGGGVAFAAHVGGFIGGFGMVALYRVVRRSKSAPVSSSAPRPRPVPRPAPPEPPPIYLYDQGTQLGPFTAAQVSDMLQLGSVSAEAYYCREGMTEWRPVAELQLPGAMGSGGALSDTTPGPA